MSHKLSPDSDFVIISYVHNAHIIRAMDRLEINILGKVRNPSIEDLCMVLRRKRGDDQTDLSKLEREIRELVGLKLVPKKPNGEWIEAAVVLSELLHTPCDTLWPGILATTIPHERAQKTETAIGNPATWTVM